MEERNKGFFCFASFYDTIMKTDKELALKYIKAVMEYGLYDDSDAMVKALMNPVVIILKRDKKEIRRAVLREEQSESSIMMRLGDWLEKVWTI